jgi:hypothetical protein
MSLANLLVQARRPLERDGHDLRTKNISNQNHQDCVIPFQNDIETPGNRASGTGGTGNASASGSTRTTLKPAEVLEFSDVEPVEPVGLPTPSLAVSVFV